MSPRRARLAASALVALLCSLLLTPAAAHAAPAPNCRELSFPVTVLHLAQTVSGTLCVPAGGADTVHLLVPGGLYNRTYWDASVHQGTRSFRAAMNRAGHATLAVDRLGSGRSSSPPSVLLTAIAQADAMHQVVGSLRAGERSPRFGTVIIAGHSLGSAVAVIEAATYRDVDGVLVTSMAHRLNVLGLVPIFATFVPAAIDPAFRGRVLDPGYLTTAPGTRFDSLHSPGAYDAEVDAADESTKDVTSPGELVDGALIGVVLPYSRRIDVPVMTVMGSGDPTFCNRLLATDCSSAGALARSEKPFYGAKAQLSTYVVDGYGHSINYAPNVAGYHAAVAEWAETTVGTPE